jgi:hypothetical protein
MPSVLGGSTGPQIAIPSSFPTFFLFFWNLRSIGKEVFLPKIIFYYLLEESVYNFHQCMHAVD